MIDSNEEIIKNFSGKRKVKNEFFYLTGDNGSGKSSLLYEIATKTYISHVTPKKLELSNNKKTNNYSQEEKNIYEANKLIACTLTPFSKFDSLNQLFNKDGYQKIGGGIGTSSKYSLIFQALIAFCNYDEKKKKIFDEIASIAKFPTLFKVRFAIDRYRIEREKERDIHSLFNPNLVAEKMLKIGGIFEFILGPGFINFHPARRYSNNLPNSLFDEPENNLEFDFLADTEDLIEAILLFRRLGALRVSRIDYLTSDKEWKSSNGFSSGQLSFFVSMMILASSIEDGSNILIDEPEVSLHPAWQRLYPRILYKISKQYKYCKYFVATHSPLIINEAINQGASVINMGSKIPNIEDVLSFDNVNIEEVFAIYFNVLTENNSFIKEIIIKSVDSLAIGNDELFNKYKSLLSIIYPRINDKDTKNIIEEILKK